MHEMRIAHGTVQWRHLVNTFVNLRVYKITKFLVRWPERAEEKHETVRTAGITTDNRID